MDFSDVTGLNAGGLPASSADLSCTRKFHMSHLSLCEEGDLLHRW